MYILKIDPSRYKNIVLYKQITISAHALVNFLAWARYIFFRR